MPTAKFSPSPRDKFNLKYVGWEETKISFPSIKICKCVCVCFPHLLMALFFCSLARTLFLRSSSLPQGSSCSPSSPSLSGLIISQKKVETSNPPGFIRCIKSMKTPRRESVTSMISGKTECKFITTKCNFILKDINICCYKDIYTYKWKT